MKKKQLLKLLEQFDDDDHIHVWNGFVCDYQPIKGIEDTFVYLEDIPLRIAMIKQECPDADINKVLSDNPSGYELDIPYKIGRKRRVGVITTGTRGKTSLQGSQVLGY